jgi:cysteine desulfurase/selenocysteine lyase
MNVIRLANDRPSVKADFPVFAANEGLVYLDSGATAQKPTSVLDRMDHFYRYANATVHRGVYRLSADATDAFEAARKTVADFIGAEAREIIFVRGATEGLNLLADCLGRSDLIKAGDAVVVSELEHHANIVPWQMLRDGRGIELRVCPISEDGGLDLVALEALLADGKVKLVSLTHVANATGTVVPVEQVVKLARAKGAMIAIDGCQAVSHRPVDVHALDVDFYVFSAHKLYGPTGTGVLYGRYELLEKLPPYQGGGAMITTVTFEKTEFAAPPQRFEAGTPDIIGVLGLAAAIDYVTALGWDWIQAHEAAVMAHGEAVLRAIPGVTILPAGPERASIFSLLVEGIHPHDLGTILDNHDVAVRAGSHCAQPLLAKYNCYATVRASVGVYNEAEDFDRLAAGIRSAQKLFGKGA